MHVNRVWCVRSCTVVCACIHEHAVLAHQLHSIGTACLHHASENEIVPWWRLLSVCPILCNLVSGIGIFKVTLPDTEHISGSTNFSFWPDNIIKSLS